MRVVQITIEGGGPLKFRPSGCSEFPNDNPEIHDGSVWVCSWTRARPRAFVRAKGASKVTEATTATRTSASSPLPLEDPFLSDLTSELAVGERTETESLLVTVPASASAPVDELTSVASDVDPFLADLVAETSEAIALEPRVLEQPMLEPPAVEREPLFEFVPPSSGPHHTVDAGNLAASHELARCRPLPSDHSVTRAAEEVAPPHTPSQSSFIEVLTALAGPGTAESDDDSSEHDAIGSLSPLEMSEFFEEPPPSEAPETNRCAQPDPISPLQLEDLSGLANDGGWQQIVTSLSSYLLQQGHTRAAALLPRLLEGQAVNVSRLPATVAQCLVAAEIASETADGFAIDEQFRIRARRMHRACVERRLDAPTIGDWLTPIVRALTATADSDERVFESMRAAGVTEVIERVA